MGGITLHNSSCAYKRFSSLKTALLCTKNIQPIKLYCQAVKMSRQNHFICISLKQRHACSAEHHHIIIIETLSFLKQKLFWRVFQEKKSVFWRSRRWSKSDLTDVSKMILNKINFEINRTKSAQDETYQFFMYKWKSKYFFNSRRSQKSFSSGSHKKCIRDFFPYIKKFHIQYYCYYYIYFIHRLYTLTFIGFK